MNRSICIISLFLILVSCKNETSKEQSNTKDEIKQDSLKPQNENLVSIRRAKHKTVEAGNPKINQAQKPTVYPTNTNISLVTDPESTEVPAELYIATPGEDSLKLPLVATVKTKTISCTQPLPVQALAPRFKDAA